MLGAMHELAAVQHAAATNPTPCISHSPEKHPLDQTGTSTMSSTLARLLPPLDSARAWRSCTTSAIVTAKARVGASIVKRGRELERSSRGER